MRPEFIFPEWSAPKRVFALQTTRIGGASTGAFASFNLGDHVGDDPAAVAANRARLGAVLPGTPLWMRQVHGVTVAEAGRDQEGVEADAVLARTPGVVCAVMTADCLPILFCDRAGSVVAAAHAGWRGLAAGVIERTLTAMRVSPGTVLAWLGPSIGAAAYEVGEEVRAAFLARDADAEPGFVPGRDGRWLADLAALARLQLARLGVTEVRGGGFCTASDAQRFFSYRRDGTTGRMATLIALTDV